MSTRGNTGRQTGSQDLSFLGREFLTWLWFKSEERGALPLPGGGDVEVEFVRRLVLESGDGDYADTVVCRGLHSDLREGKAALREGKKIREARIRLRRDRDEWKFTFKADCFRFQSLKMPASMADLDEEDRGEGRILERIHLVEAVMKIMDHLFSAFLKIRLSSQWAGEEAPQIMKWIQDHQA